MGQKEIVNRVMQYRDGKESNRTQWLLCRMLSQERWDQRANLSFLLFTKDCPACNRSQVRCPELQGNSRLSLCVTWIWVLSPCQWNWECMVILFTESDHCIFLSLFIIFPSCITCILPWSSFSLNLSLSPFPLSPHCTKRLWRKEMSEWLSTQQNGLFGT